MTEIVNSGREWGHTTVSSEATTIIIDIRTAISISAREDGARCPPVSRRCYLGGTRAPGDGDVYDVRFVGWPYGGGGDGEGEDEKDLAVAGRQARLPWWCEMERFWKGHPRFGYRVNQVGTDRGSLMKK
jgi:hypothetical protein